MRGNSMLTLMKYDFIECYKPFGLIVVIHIVLAFTSSLGLYSKESHDTLTIIYYPEDWLFVIFGCRRIYVSFCTEKDILGLAVPEGVQKRIFSKLFTLSLLYIILQISRSLFNLVNPYSIYNVMKDNGDNYKSYMLYDFIGGTVFYISTVTIVIFGMILANSLARKKVIVPILNGLIIFGLLWSSNIFNGKYIDNTQNTNKIIQFKTKEATIHDIIDIKYRTKYAPFSYVPISGARYIVEDDKVQINLDPYSWSGVEYGAVCIVIFLAGSMALLKWKGINY